MNEENKEKIVKFFKEILNVYDFEIIIDINEDLDKVFRLHDIQGGNLGEIDKETFFTLADIIERLDLYHQDYVYNPLEIKQNDNVKIQKDDWELITKRYLENDEIAKVLSEIHTKEYSDLISKKEKFEIQDIIKILDEDEQFYKNVCEKYVETMLKEMLLEIDDKILHIYIKDEYIDLKENGEINSQNYKDYLDENFEIYKYNFYQDLYNSVIKNEIAYDLNDLPLFNYNGKWEFYITFKELKKMGYGFMVKDNYPLIKKYAVSEEKIFDFFNYFSLKQLDDFEKTLYLYFETDDIKYDKETLELYSKSNNVFNSNIICLVEGVVSYEDFVEDFEQNSLSYSDICLTKVSEYFRENKIKNLMDYGADTDEGLYHLSSLYSEIMNKLGIKFSNIFTEDGSSDGKYVTTITFENDSKIQLDTSAWDGIKVISENMEYVYKNHKKEQNIIKENELEIDYDYN